MDIIKQLASVDLLVIFRILQNPFFVFLDADGGRLKKDKDAQN